MIYLILCFIPIFVFIFINRIFQADYSLTMIIGQKGAGKTTLMVKYMLKYKKRGYTIYTDLKSINIPGVRIINALDLNTFTPAKKSALFLDEVGLTFDNRQYRTFSTGLRDWFALQRHYETRVFQNSQSFDIDKKLRDRTDEFLFVQKIMGPVSLIRPIVLRVKPNDMTKADCENPTIQYYRWGSLSSWSLCWLPKYAKYFNSFEIPDRKEIPYSEVPDKGQMEKQPLSDRIYAKYLLAKLNHPHKERTRKPHQE